ncbi:hypothetical protein [Rhizobium sp. SSA_523]|uniref:hypothetical protein n=1 Tax=Rhizobium sp. SSA_523 TaxID=2952477 RepID=UPI00209135C9|nr:hypothetical protein [Rhizobium sp. SSA_523]MCO5734092.1 hypothetical protein [Rhizobium sp. SSA_523]WKC24730.1 hypothetical protein QTJ18_11935 [Rhizobium sp. SSA_523]
MSSNQGFGIGNISAEATSVQGGGLLLPVIEEVRKRRGCVSSEKGRREAAELVDAVSVPIDDTPVMIRLRNCQISGSMPQVLHSRSILGQAHPFHDARGFSSDGDVWSYLKPSDAPAQCVGVGSPLKASADTAAMFVGEAIAGRSITRPGSTSRSSPSNADKAAVDGVGAQQLADLKLINIDYAQYRPILVSDLDHFLFDVIVQGNPLGEQVRDESDSSINGGEFRALIVGLVNSASTNMEIELRHASSSRSVLGSPSLVWEARKIALQFYVSVVIPAHNRIKTTVLSMSNDPAHGLFRHIFRSSDIPGGHRSDGDGRIVTSERNSSAHMLTSAGDSQVMAREIYTCDLPSTIVDQIERCIGPFVFHPKNRGHDQNSSKCISNSLLIEFLLGQNTKLLVADLIPILHELILRRHTDKPAKSRFVHAVVARALRRVISALTARFRCLTEIYAGFEGAAV